VVVNNTKVFNARLRATLLPSSASVEFFLIRPTTGNTWQAIGKPGKKFQVGTLVTIAPDFTATVIQTSDDGTFTVSFPYPPDQVIAKANIYGLIPIPPYIKKQPKPGDYQTVYAKEEGSVAAPTAGFHLTPTLLSQLKKNHITVLEITLHVGLGTFLPIKTINLEDHVMHSEWVHISESVAHTINEAKRQGRRVIAIGTTTVRALEGISQLNGGSLKEYSGDVNLFIAPGYQFNIIDGLLTNFHLPQSTLLVLVAALAGRTRILNAYREAVDRGYRFYSFGDAMLLL
jgi:S-adenosylmethionine:tRNA ribosyltransferase-isomerase